MRLSVISIIFILLSASLNSEENNNHGIDLGYIEDGIKKIEVYTDGSLTKVTEFFPIKNKAFIKRLGNKEKFYNNCPKYNDSLVSYLTIEYFLSKNNKRVDSTNSKFYDFKGWIMSPNGSTEPSDSIPVSIISQNYYLSWNRKLFSQLNWRVINDNKEKHKSEYYCHDHSQLKFKTIIDHTYNEIKLIQYEYDSTGKKVYEYETDKNFNRETKFIYDSLGKLKQLNSLSVSNYYTYDTLGNLKSLIGTKHYSDSRKDTTYYEYDDSLLISRTYISKGKQTNYTYKYYYYD